MVRVAGFCGRVSVLVPPPRAQFFLRQEDVGKPKAAVTQPRLAELNNYAPIELYSGALSPDFLAQFGIVVVAGGVPMSQALTINEACRANGTRFIMAETFGVFGYTFCDFGDEFVVYAPPPRRPRPASLSLPPRAPPPHHDRRPAAGTTPMARTPLRRWSPPSCVLARPRHRRRKPSRCARAVDRVGAPLSRAQDNSGAETVVACLDEARHGLEDGDYVSFSEVGGMDELNAAPARPVKVLGPYTFSVEGLEAMGSHTQGGIVTQVKQKKVLAFKSLREAIANPDAACVAPDVSASASDSQPWSSPGREPCPLPCSDSQPCSQCRSAAAKHAAAAAEASICSSSSSRRRRSIHAA